MAVGAGFADGLGYGDNTKAAVIRLGLMEIVKFCEVFYPGNTKIPPVIAFLNHQGNFIIMGHITHVWFK